MYAQGLASPTHRRGQPSGALQQQSDRTGLGRGWGLTGTAGTASPCGPERCRWVSRSLYYRLGQEAAPSPQQPVPRTAHSHTLATDTH